MDSERERTRRVAWASAAAAGILSLFYLHVWLRTGPHLLLHQWNPSFVTTWVFLRGFLDRPGGVLEYVSAFLLQLCWWSWAGALVITAIAGLICLGTRGFLNVTLGRRVHPAIYFVPAVLLLTSLDRYRHPLALSVGILGALAVTNLYVRVTHGNAAARLGVFAVLLALFYYAAGGVAVLAGVLCGVFETLRKRNPVGGALTVLLAAGLPLLTAAWSYRTGLLEAFGPLVLTDARDMLPTPAALPGQWASHVLLLAYFPLAVPLAMLAAAISRRRGRPRGADATGGPPTRPAGLWTVTSFAVFLSAAAAVTWLAFDVQARTRLEIDYHASRRDWQAVLRSAERLERDLYDGCVVHDVNLALHHTGKMSTGLFSFPQGPGDPIVRLVPKRITAGEAKRFSGFFLEVGHVNLAEHWAHEALELEGERPDMLQRLVTVNVVKKRLPLARTFLCALGRHLLYRDRAEDCRRRLDRSPLDAEDAQIVHLRSVMQRTDRPYGAFANWSFPQLMVHQLDENPRNRMAFEYLMTCLLLERRSDLVVVNLRRLDDFRDEEIPVLWEEAALVLEATRPGVTVDLGGRTIRQETRDRLRAFLEDAVRHRQSAGDEQETAYRTLVERWGDTYFFYFTFGYSEPRPGWRLRKPDAVTGATK